MSSPGQQFAGGRSKNPRRISLLSFAAARFVSIVWTLRKPISWPNLLCDADLLLAGSLIAFTFAAGPVFRLRGTRDGITLVLAFGFILSGLFEAASSVTSARAPHVLAADSTVPMVRLIERTLLPVLLVARLAIESPMPLARDLAGKTNLATLAPEAAVCL